LTANVSQIASTRSIREAALGFRRPYVRTHWTVT
jgi:hypothetical protein